MKATGADYPCRVVDRRTGEDIPHCVWADDATGEAERQIRDTNGLVAVDENGEPLCELLTGLDIAIVPLPGSPLFQAE